MFCARVCVWCAFAQPVEFLNRDPKSASFSEKKVTEMNEESSHRMNPFTGTGESSTLVHLASLLCPEDKEKQPVPPYCAVMLEGKGVPMTMERQEELSLWDLPNAQFIPPIRVPRSRASADFYPISGYSADVVGGKGTKERKEPEKFHSVSCDEDSASLLNEEMDVDSQSNTSQRLDRISDSLKALPDRISRMNEQWRDALQEIKRFTTHSDACIGTMRLEILEVK